MSAPRPPKSRRASGPTRAVEAFPLSFETLDEPLEEAEVPTKPERPRKIDGRYAIVRGRAAR